VASRSKRFWLAGNIVAVTSVGMAMTGAVFVHFDRVWLGLAMTLACIPVGGVAVALWNKSVDCQ
jgi:hypothetical protein